MKRTKKKYDRAETRRILSEYVLEYIIYIDSGYDPQKALQLLSEREDGSPLSAELKAAVNMTGHNVSFHKALLAVSDRIYDLELDSFLRIVSRGYEKGDTRTADDLRILIERMLHDDISVIKAKAEKASTKMTFPITLIFIAIVVIAVYPALTQFKF